MGTLIFLVTSLCDIILQIFCKLSILRRIRYVNRRTDKGRRKGKEKWILCMCVLKSCIFVFVFVFVFVLRRAQRKNYQHINITFSLINLSTKILFFKRKEKEESRERKHNRLLIFPLVSHHTTYCTVYIIQFRLEF